MCQILNIWQIYHTKHKIGALWDVPNLKNYTTWLQYRCKFAMVRTDVVKYLLFYIPISLSSLFIFSFLFSLTLRFPLSSPCAGSLPLRPVRDVHRQQRRRSSDDDSALRHAWSPFSHLISPTLQLRSILVTLDLADLTPRPLSISRLATLQPLCLSLVVGFFFAAIWVDLIVVVGCGLWVVTVAVVVGCGGDGPLLSVWINGYLFVWISVESVLNQWWWLCLVIGICWFFFSCFVGGFCLVGCVMVEWWWWLLPCWACVVVKWWLCRWSLVGVVAVVVVGGCCCLVIGICFAVGGWDNILF